MTKEVIRCPECGAVMVLRETTKFTYRNGAPRKFYGCSRFPDCRAAHGAHPDGAPLGVPANLATKQSRMKAHAAFDGYAERKGLSKKQRYLLLQDLMAMTKSQAHIANFDTPTCEVVVERITALDRNEWPDGAVKPSKIIATLLGVPNAEPEGGSTDAGRPADDGRGDDVRGGDAVLQRPDDSNRTGGDSAGGVGSV